MIHTAFTSLELRTQYRVPYRSSVRFCPYFEDFELGSVRLVARLVAEPRGRYIFGYVHKPSQ